MQIAPRFLPPVFISNGIPKINRGHPIANGLVGVWMPGLAQFNLVTGAALLLQGTSGKFPFAGPFGSQFNMNGGLGNTGFQTSDPLLLTKNPAQWSIWGLISSSGSTSTGTPFYGERGSSGNDIIKLDLNESGPTYDVTIRNDAGTLLQVQSTGAAPTDGKFHSVAGTKNGNGGSGNVILYIDGAVNNTGNWTGAENYTDATLVGGVLFDAQDTSAAHAHLVITAAWTRVLSPAEVIMLNSDPFCMLTFPEEYIADTLVGRATATSVIFRKTFSQIGGRVGTRQQIGWGM